MGHTHSAWLFNACTRNCDCDFWRVYCNQSKVTTVERTSELRPLLLPVSGATQVFGVVFGLLVWLLGAGVGPWLSVVVVFVTFACCVWGFLTVRIVSPALDLRRDFSFWLLGPCLGFGLLSLLLLRVVLPREIFLGVFVLVPVSYALLRGSRRLRLYGTGRVDWFRSQEAFMFAFVVTGLAGLSLASWWWWSMPITFVALSSAAFLAIVGPRKSFVGWFFTVPLVLVAWWMSQIRPNTWWLGAAGIPTDESHLEAYANGLVEFGPLVNPLWHGYDGLTATAYHHLSYLFVGIINVLGSAQPYAVQHLVAPAVFAVSLVSSLLLFIRHAISHLKSPPALNTLTFVGILTCMILLRLEGAPSNTFGPTVLLASFVVIARVNESPATWRNAALIGLCIVATFFAKAPFAVSTATLAVIVALFDFPARWKSAVAAVFTFFASVLYFSSVGPTDTSLRFQFWAPQSMFSEFGFTIYHLKLFLTFIVLPLVVGVAGVVIALVERGLPLKQWLWGFGVLIIGGALSQVLLASNEDRGHRYFAAPAFICSGLILLTLTLAMNEKSRVSVSMHVLFLVISAGIYSLLDLAIGPTDSKLQHPLTVIALVSVALVVGGIMARKASRSSFLRLSSIASVLALFLLLVGFLIDTGRSDSQNVMNIPNRNATRSWSNWLGDRDTVTLIEFVRRTTDRSDLLSISTCDPKLLASDVCEPDYRIPALTQRRFLAADYRFSLIDPKVVADVVLSGPIDRGRSGEVVKSLGERGVTYSVIRKSGVHDRGIAIKMQYRNQIQFENNTFLVVKLNNLQANE